MRKIGCDADSDVLFEMEKAPLTLENTPGFLDGLLREESYGETWSVRKVLRRFIWHDRIHARAMWRMAKKTIGK